MAELGEEKNVFGGVEFEGNNNNVENIANNEVPENAGTIRNNQLPVKTGFWNNSKHSGYKILIGTKKSKLN